MKRYNMKRKIAAMLCVMLLSGSVTPSAFAEAFLIMPGGDALSQQLMESSQAGESKTQSEQPEEQNEPAPAAAVEAIEIRKDPVIEMIKPAAEPVIELKKAPVVEAVVPEVSIVEAIVPDQTVLQDVKQAETPAAEVEQQVEQIEKAPDALQPPEADQMKLQIQQIQKAPDKGMMLSVAPLDNKVEEKYSGASVTSVSPVSAAGQKDGRIEGKVTFTSDRDVVVKLYNASGSYVTDVKIEHGSGSEKTGTFAFGGLAEGEYSVEIWFSGDGYAGLDPQEVIREIKVGVKEVEPQAPASEYLDATVYSKDSTDKTTADGSIEGSVSFKGAAALLVFAYDANGDEAARVTLSPADDGGERTAKFSLENLPAGEYTLHFRFKGDAAAGIDVRGKKVVTIRSATLDPITLTVSENNGKITATISGAMERDIDVWINEVSEDGEKRVSGTIIWGNGTAELGTFANGSYKVYADYASPTFDANGNSTTRKHSDTITVTGGGSTTVTPERPSVTEITGNVSKTKDSITVSLHADNDFKVVIAIEGKNTGYSSMVEIAPGAALTHIFTGLAEDTYEIYADYYDGFGGISPYETTVKLSASAVQIKASAVGGDNRVDVTIGESDALAIVVKLFKDGKEITAKTIAAGAKSASFESLAAGEYSVTIDYETPQDGSNAVTIDKITVKDARTGIAIGEVTGGENKLVVKGTAQAGAQILVSAEPATAKGEVLLVKDDGTFTANLMADPGVYTKVSAYYVTDAATLVSKSGSWTVTAPAAPPTITVDPIDYYSTTVVVKTGANLSVTLKTPDSTQTLVSDADGLVRFSLTHKYLKGDEFIVTVVYGAGEGQSVSKKVTVGGASDYKDLEYGDYGEAVLRLTTRLHELGYPVVPTKDYNKTVREAVRLFQIANGQEADGEAGDRMQAALFSVSAIPYKAGRYPTLVRGDKGLSLIYTLQQRLKDLGYYTIKVDGIFGSGTQRAVRLFQSVNGLPETGIADNATQVLLYSSAAKPLGYGTTGEYKTLQRSSKYKSAVVPLQRRLKALGYYSGSIDGYFGSKTYRAVRNFQSRNSLKVTGIADPLTQQVLYSSSAKKYNGSTASSSTSSSVGYRLLYWGCRGDAVTRLQNALISAGYKSLVRKADGIFGQWTYDAVRAYQKDHGLVVDGIAGKNTQNSLYGTNY